MESTETEELLPVLQAESGSHAAGELSALLEQAGLKADETRQLRSQREAFLAHGIALSDEELLSFYQSTKLLEPARIAIALDSVAERIIRFRGFGNAGFDYSDWRSVLELEREFLQFGLSFADSELFELYEAEPTEVFRFFRVKIHSNLQKMLDLISQENEQLPPWLASILNGVPGAEAVILRESEQREAYKNLLNTLFDSHGLTERRYLVEQVLNSWTQ